MVHLSIIIFKNEITLIVPRNFIPQRFKDEVENIFVNVTQSYEGLHGHYTSIYPELN